MGAGAVSDKSTRAHRATARTGRKRVRAHPAGARELQGQSPKNRCCRSWCIAAVPWRVSGTTTSSPRTSCRARCTSPMIRWPPASTSSFRSTNSPSMSRHCAKRPGADFPPGVPQSARDGTRNNLLSEACSMGELPDDPPAGHGYPGGGRGLRRRRRNDAQGRHARAARSRSASSAQRGAIVASGEFPLSQSELGLKPFSVAMGTLVVLDEMRVRFEVDGAPVDSSRQGADPISYFASSASSASAP